MKAVMTNEYNKIPAKRYKMTAVEIESALNERDKITSKIDKCISEIFILKLGDSATFELITA